MGFGNIGEAVLNKAAKLGTNVTAEAIESTAKKTIPMSTAKSAYKELGIAGKANKALQEKARPILAEIYGANPEISTADLVNEYRNKVRVAGMKAPKDSPVASGVDSLKISQESLATNTDFNPELKLTDIASDYKASSAEEYKHYVNTGGNHQKNVLKQKSIDELEKEALYESSVGEVAPASTYSPPSYLSEKITSTADDFLETEAMEQTAADTAATLDSINRGTFFTSGLGRVQSTLDVQTSAIRPITNGLGGINLLTNPETNPIAFGSNQSVQKAKQNILKADLEAKHYAGKTADEIRYDKYMRKNAQYSGSNTEKAALEKQNTETPWSRGAKIVLGTAVTGAALCAALSSSRGQQNNAQLYGQQPLY